MTDMDGSESSGGKVRDEQLLKILLEGSSAQRSAAQMVIVKKASNSNCTEFDWTKAKKEELVQVCTSLQEDMENSKNPFDALYSAVSVASLVVSKEELVQLLPLSTLDGLAKSALLLAKKEKDKKLLSRILWGFAKEKYPLAIYKKYYDELIDIITESLCDKQSAVVVFEGLKILVFLLNNVQLAIDKAVDFFPEVFSQLFHNLTRVRRLALKCTELLLEQPDCKEVLAAVVRKAVPEIKASYSKVLCGLMDEAQLAMEGLLIWQACVRMLGKQLHSGTTLINSLLAVIERGFKSSDSLVRVEAFKCWSILIDNFSLDKSVLCSNKRLRLLVAPYVANNAKNGEIFEAKLKSWWHLLHCVGDSVAIQNFELLVVPLLQFCFKNPVASVSPKSPGPTKSLQASPAPASLLPAVQYKCIHILFSLLTKSEETLQLLNDCDLEQLQTPMVSVAQYSKHHCLFHESVHKVMHFLVKLECPSKLITDLSQAIVSLLSEHLKVATVREGAELLKDLFTVLKSCITECCTELEMANVPPHKMSMSNAMLQVVFAMVSGPTAFAPSVLSSRHYHLGGGGNLMRGTLSSSLVDFLLLPSVLAEAEPHLDMYKSVLEAVLLSYKMDGSLRIGFIDGVSRSLGSLLSALASNGDQPAAGASKKALLLCTDPARVASLASSVWIVVAQAARIFIDEMQTLNVCDESEDSSGVYNLLLLPLQRATLFFSDLQEAMVCSVVKEWCAVYRSFAGVALLSASASPNYSAQHVCKHVLLTLSHRAGPPDLYANCIVFCCALVSCCISSFKFGMQGNSTNENKNGRRRGGSLQELEEPVSAVVELWGRVGRMVGKQRQAAARHLTQTLAAILTRVKHHNMMLPLVSALLDTFTTLVEVNPSARYGKEESLEIIRVFETYCTLVEEHCNLSCGDTATSVVTLVQSALNSTNPAIVQKALKLWRSIGKQGLSQSLLQATDQLAAQHLEALPNQANGGEGTRPRTKPGFATPKPQSAPLSSHSDKTILSTSTTFTPNLKTGTPHRTRSSTTSLLQADDIEFVPISSPAVGHKRVLTPHQREKLQERRCDIPALYSDLSQQASQSYSETSSMPLLEGEAAGKKVLKATGARRSLETRSTAFSDADKRDDHDTPAADSLSEADNAVLCTSGKTEDAKAGQVLGIAEGNAERSKRAEEVLDQCVTDHSTLSVQKENSNISIQSDLTSKDENPDSQASGVNENCESLNNFNNRTRQVLGSFRSSPRVIPNIDGIEPLAAVVEPVVTDGASADPVTTDDGTVVNGGGAGAESTKTTDTLYQDVTCLRSTGAADATEIDAKHSRPEASSAMKSSSENSAFACKPVELADDNHEPSPLKGAASSDQIGDKKGVSSSNTTPTKGKAKLDVLATPSKITRSGRKIVPPKKGMPEPLTPPGPSFSGRKSGTPKSLPGTPCHVLKKNDSSISPNEINVPSSPFQGMSKAQKKSNCEENFPAKKSVQKKISEMFALSTDPSTKSFDSSVLVDINSNEEDEVLPVLNRAATSHNYSRRCSKSKAEVTFENLVIEPDFKNRVAAQDCNTADESSGHVSNNMTVKVRRNATECQVKEIRALEKEGVAEDDEASSSKTCPKSDASLIESDDIFDDAPSTKDATITQTTCADRSSSPLSLECHVEEQEFPSNSSSQEKTADVYKKFVHGKRTRKYNLGNFDASEVKNKPAPSISSNKHIINGEKDKTKLEDSAGCSAPYDSDDEPLVRKLRSTKKSSAKHQNVRECGKHFSENEDSVSTVNQNSFLNNNINFQEGKRDQSQSSLSGNSNEATSTLNTEREQALENIKSNQLPDANKRGKKRCRDIPDETNTSAKRRNTRSQHDFTMSNVKLNDYVSMRRGIKRKLNGSNTEPKRGDKGANKPAHTSDASEIAVECEESSNQESLVLSEASTGKMEIDVRGDSTGEMPVNIVLSESQDNISAEKLDACLALSNTPESINTVKSDVEPVLCEGSSVDGENVSLSVAGEVTSTACLGGTPNDGGLIDTSHASESNEEEILKVPSGNTNDTSDIISNESAEVATSLHSANQCKQQLLPKEEEETVESSDALGEKSSFISLDNSNDQAEHLPSSPAVMVRSSDNTATPPAGNSRDAEEGLDKRRSASMRIKCSRSGSRAAFMVACAQSKMVASSPTAAFTPSRTGKDSPPVSECGSLDEKARCTPPAGGSLRLSSTPRSRQLWPRHRHSSAASPGGSILKKPLVDSGSKGRRVSFADPPVSKSVVIINEEATETGELCLSPRGRPVPLSVRAQKRLDMSRATASTSPQLSQHSKLTKIIDPSLLPQQPSPASLAQLVESGKDSDDATKCSKVIYNNLADCSAPVSCLLSSLTSLSLTASLEAVLLNRGFDTVGQVASLTEEDLAGLPIKPPKLQTTVSALQRFESTLAGASDDPAGKDTSESELWELTKEESFDAPIMEVCEATLPQKGQEANLLQTSLSVSFEACDEIPSSFEEQVLLTGAPAVLFENETTAPDKNAAADTCEEESFSVSAKESNKPLTETSSKPREKSIDSHKTNFCKSDGGGILSVPNENVSGSSSEPRDEVCILQPNTSKTIIEDASGDKEEPILVEQKASSAMNFLEHDVSNVAAAEELQNSVQCEGQDNSDKENSSPERRTSSSAGPACLRTVAARSLAVPEEAKEAFILQRSEGQRKVLAELTVGLEHESDEEDEEASSCPQDASLKHTSSISVFKKYYVEGVSDAAAGEQSCEGSTSKSPDEIVATMKAMSPDMQDAVLAALLPAMQYTQVVDAFTRYLRQRE